MSKLRIVPIVEGDGEVPSVPILLRRIGQELLGGVYIDVLKPILRPRSRLVANKENELENSLGLAAFKLKNTDLTDFTPLILVLLDADDDRVCELGPRLLQDVKSFRSDLDVSFVLANLEYESWFVGAAQSLGQYLNLAPNELSVSPEATRSRKKWIEDRFKNRHYKETVDQPKLTAKMDLTLCRSRCPSFDKLCRELERRLVTN